MQKTKIEWLHWPDGSPGYSWNPVKGLCPVACFYCYARRIYKRLKRPENLSFDPDYKFYPRRPSRIFVCSTMELFNPAVKVEWRDWIFYEIKKHPEHTFFILTKQPQNIDRPMPDNVWLGVSVTNQEDADKRIPLLLQAEVRVRFVSIEPMLGPVSLLNGMKGNYLDGSTVEFGPGHFNGRQFVCGCAYFIPTSKLIWVIVGRLTGRGQKYNPKSDWIKSIIDECRTAGTPLFMKNNLASIWPGKLIQEFPE